VSRSCVCWRGSIRRPPRGPGRASTGTPVVPDRPPRRRFPVRAHACVPAVLDGASGGGLMVTPVHDPGCPSRRADSHRAPCRFLPPGPGLAVPAAVRAVRNPRLVVLKIVSRLDVWGGSPATTPQRGSVYASAYASGAELLTRRGHVGPVCSAFATNTQAARSSRARMTDQSLRPKHSGRPCRTRNPGFPGEGPHARRHPPQRRMAGRSAGPAAGRAPGRPPTLEPAPPALARAHATRPVASSFSAADS